MRKTPAPDLAALLPSWQLSLEAEHKSPGTVRTYTASARQFTAWCEREGGPAVLDRRTVAAFLAALLAGGAEPATANIRYRSLRRFGAWLAEEGETDGNPLAGMAPPKLDKKIVPKL